MRKDTRNGSSRASRVGPGFEPTEKDVMRMLQRLCRVIPRCQVAAMTGGAVPLLRKIELGIQATGRMASKSIWFAYVATFEPHKLSSALSIASWGELSEEPRPAKVKRPDAAPGSASKSFIGKVPVIT